MRGVHAARAALLAAVACSASVPVAAGQMITARGDTFDARGSSLSELDEVRMPSGYAAFCARQPSECAPEAAALHTLILSPERWKLLAGVNTEINHRIAPTTDQTLYGKVEYWTIPDKAGDCEDYVLLKRRTLARLGLPEASLLITVVHDENGEGHAVLTVPTTSGDLVLDNRRDEVLDWQATGYAFIKRQSARNADVWVSLGHEKLQAADIASGPEAP